MLFSSQTSLRPCLSHLTNILTLLVSFYDSVSFLQTVALYCGKVKAKISLFIYWRSSFEAITRYCNNTHVFVLFLRVCVSTLEENNKWRKSGKREREAARGKFSLALIVKDRIFVWGKASVCVFHVFELS